MKDVVVWCENSLCSHAEYYADCDAYYCTERIIKIKARGCEDYDPVKRCGDCEKYHSDDCWNGDFSEEDEFPCDEFEERRKV